MTATLDFQVASTPPVQPPEYLDAPPMLSPLLACTAQATEPWFAVEVANRCEKSFAWKLLDAKIAYYLPLIHVIRRIAHFRRRLILPLFPNYLFIVGDENSFASHFCVESRHVFNRLVEPNQQQLRRDLANLEIVLHHNPSLEIAEITGPKQKVRVVSGPFEGLEGETDKVYESKGMVRVHVAVTTLGCAVVLDIDRTDLERL